MRAVSGGQKVLQMKSNAKGTHLQTGALSRYLGLGVMITLLLLPTWLSGHAVELRPGILNVGFTHSCFQGVNRNDAEVSFKAYLASFGRQRGYELETKVKIFDTLSAFEAAIKRKEIHLAVLDAWQYVAIDIRQVMDPYFVSVPKDVAGRKYVILTRQGSGLNAFRDLRGKELSRLEIGAAAMGGHWLETLLLANGQPSAESFFAKVEVVRKPAAAVLPVFFGKRHACLVDVESFEVMRELNPQLGNVLQVVAASEPCVDNVICLAKDGWTSSVHKEDTIRVLGDLHKEPAGQQILVLFKIAGLVPYQDMHLDAVRKLFTTYSQLRKKGGS